MASHGLQVSHSKMPHLKATCAEKYFSSTFGNCFHTTPLSVAYAADPLLSPSLTILLLLFHSLLCLENAVSNPNVFNVFELLIVLPIPHNYVQCSTWVVWA